jgi:hypothetical protein
VFGWQAPDAIVTDADTGAFVASPAFVGQDYVLVSADGYAAGAFEIVVYDDGCGWWTDSTRTAVALEKR